jgi:hypothetical protein
LIFLPYADILGIRNIYRQEASSIQVERGLLQTHISKNRTNYYKKYKTPRNYYYLHKLYERADYLITPINYCIQFIITPRFALVNALILGHFSYGYGGGELFGTQEDKDSAATLVF